MGWLYHWCIFVMLPGSSHTAPHSFTITTLNRTAADNVLLKRWLTSKLLPQLCFDCPTVSSAHGTRSNRWLCSDCGLSLTLESHFSDLSSPQKKSHSCSLVSFTFILSTVHLPLFTNGNFKLSLYICPKCISTTPVCSSPPRITSLDYTVIDGNRCNLKGRTRRPNLFTQINSQSHFTKQCRRQECSQAQTHFSRHLKMSCQDCLMGIWL